jgi:hypothetical protein
MTCWQRDVIVIFIFSGNNEKTVVIYVKLYTEIIKQNYRAVSKGKVDPVLFLIEHHTMKTYWGSGGIAPCIL